MIKVFKYIEEFGFFVVEPVYKKIADELCISEWSEVVWIGRYFILDNDYGEHWFDNWELREKHESEIAKLGIGPTEVFIVDPDRFENGKDGPCHTYEERKRFWTDVLKSLQISYNTLCFEARKINEQNKELNKESYIENIEERITQVRIKYVRE